MSKYNNLRTAYDGINFDSKKEAERYMDLKLLERAGAIKDLQLQVPFELVPKQKGERAVRYIADFVYYDAEKHISVVEDVKGCRTREYIIKRKLFKYLYGTEFMFLET